MKTHSLVDSYSQYTYSKLSLICKMLSTKVLVVLFCFAFQSSVLASLNLHGQPLFSGVTSFTLATATKIVNKSKSCYTTVGKVSQCRRKRGMEEKPQIQLEGLDIEPSAVMGYNCCNLFIYDLNYLLTLFLLSCRVEATPAPRSPRFNSKDFNSQMISSSFDDSYLNTMNIFRQLASKGSNNVISVGDCGMSTVNFSQFLSCLGLTVQETTTLTATFTETITSIGPNYNTMTVRGCTPAGFPYRYCPKRSLQAPGSPNDDETKTNSQIVDSSPDEI
jgi:hypothetical protein